MGRIVGICVPGWLSGPYKAREPLLACSPERFPGQVINLPIFSQGSRHCELGREKQRGLIHAFLCWNWSKN